MLNSAATYNLRRSTQWEDGVCLWPNIEHAALSSPTLALPDTVLPAGSRRAQKLVLQLRVRPSPAIAKHIISISPSPSAHDANSSVAAARRTITGRARPDCISLADVGAGASALPPKDDGYVDLLNENKCIEVEMWIMRAPVGSRLNAANGLVAYGLMLQI